MLQNINHKLRQAFSESADQYDLLASLHREIGRELMHKVVKEPNAKAILDVGCGTGYLTAKAKFYFPDSKIVGLDFAQGMLKKAQEKHEGIIWVLADAQALPFAACDFDIIISNLAYQWAGNLEKAFSEAGRVLSKDGVFACTLFGFHTCSELFESFDLASDGKLKFTRLPNLEEVRIALDKAGCMDAKIDYERIKVQFKNMHELMQWLKSIGANNLPREGTIGKDMIAKASEIYQKQFPYHQGVCATFEVIWIYAFKRENRQESGK